MDPREFARTWQLGDWSAESHGRPGEYADGLGPSRFQYAPLHGRTLAIPSTNSASELRSCRSFTTQGLDDAQLTELLTTIAPTPTGMTYGSAGALYSVHPYVFRPRDGRAELWYVDTNGFQLTLVDEVDGRDVSDLLIEKWAWPIGGLVSFVIDFRRVTDKYGFRGLRFAMIEAGQLTQLLREKSALLGLDSCVLGGFADDALLRVLGLSRDWYGVAIMVAVGHERR